MDKSATPAEGATETPADLSTLPNATEYSCPDGKGVMLLRKSRYGAFLGCSSYPKCKTLLKCSEEGKMQEGQEFKCTYSEAAETKTRVKKTTKASKATTKTPRATPRKSKPSA
jgi:ssDNA-binding Zn-finger/Zn-ribbon topoisomerase 1